MSIKNVAIIGASGNLGPWVLRALLESKQFNVTVLKRHGSNATFDEKDWPGLADVKTLPVDYTQKTTEVAGILKGQDAFVSVLPGGNVREHQSLATACCVAKVQRMILGDYGSVDSSDQVCIDLVPQYYRNKKTVRDSIQGMSQLYPPFHWSSLINGHFLDFGLATPLLGFDVSSDPPSALIFDGGDIRWSATSRARIGAAVVKLLQPELLDATRNSLCYVQGINVTQNDVLAAFERVSGVKWNVTHVDSQEYIRQRAQMMADGTGHDPVEEMVGVLGVTRGNWELKDNFMNEKFGFEPESMEDAVKEAWENRGKK